MIKTCRRCGCKFETWKSKPFCPVCRNKELNETRRERDKLKRKQDRERIQILYRLKVDKSVGKPTKTLTEWMREAAESNLDYGTYRTLIEFQGKTFDELRTQNQNRSATHHARGHHRSKCDD